MMRFTVVLSVVLLVMAGCEGDDSATTGGSPDGGTAGDAASGGDSAIWPDGGSAGDGASDGASDGATATCLVGASGAYTGADLPAQAGAFEAVLAVTPASAPIEAAVALSGLAGTTLDWPDLAAIVRFNPAGFIDARSGDGYLSAASIPYVAGTTYSVRLAVDVASHRYSIFVASPGEGEVALGTDYEFRSEQAEVASLVQWGVESDTGSLQACLVSLTPGPSAVSVVVSPAAVALAPAEQQQFTATVNGDANKAVTWSIVEPSGCGQVANGLYTAPGTSGTCHVRATSVADPKKSDTATVTVEAIASDAIVLAPNGSDSLGDGTLAKPWHTLAKAWTAVAAGKTVYLRGGTYQWSAKQSLSGKNGTAGNMIKVLGYPGEHPNITVTPTFDYGSWPGAVIYFQGDYVHWKGLEISNAAQRPDGTGGHGMYVMNAENNVFENLHVHHNALGFKMDGRYYGQTTGNLILNSDFHHNGDPYTPGDPYGNGDGLELGYNTTGESNTVRGCRSWSNSDDGYDLWSNDGTVVIDNCWAWKNGYIPGTSTKGGDGHGFKFGKSDDDHASAIVTATRCVSAQNRLAGFHQNGMQAPVVLYNNIAHHNGSQGYWFGELGKAHKLTNDIAFDNGSGAAVLTSQSAVTTCTFTQSGANNGSSPVSAATFVSLDFTELESPRKPDGSLPDIDYLHLQASSPLVDSGTAVGLPHLGAGPDLGPFDR